MAETGKDIELRSEKVRNIVGQIPPVLLRRGITIISLILLSLFIGAYFVPYPETVTINIQLQHIPDKAQIRGISYCSPQIKQELQEEQIVHLEIAGYPSSVFGLVEGRISTIDSIPEIKDTGQPRFKIEISFPGPLQTSSGQPVPYFHQMHGTGTILLSNESILERFIKSITNK
jgi:hypothetical protein